ncbi:glutamate-1-semialdehyde 2,1-aminomutase [Paenibacillus alvei]|uniref:glutamate-1-semialdehyde 2,1-aminomutase n=1 Tax=Paenibacillus alvei TaxID=44250 RepID=UPI0018CFE164|nr:glutamate-1-semialdehyde 2,1-aminomutase [Paenibacillus alvei]MBG9737578.1 glutamate-1-semialdehyde aminotransferase [Paenibacillus alvei]MBG9747270.1 glutamate-1-semialdehyde aminotransferase [Paenibacillus alvei]MCY9581245.1 glutamate-1-semialdehyde 2,1-aminomutase [Paenibacillus alvei]MCY9584465.1 glutamate-1-semialdehyde 2,1-aminomutase [Paenibacillus alvei]
MKNALEVSRSKSVSAYEEAKRVIPGGVNSPVRAFSSVDLTPVFAASGQGSRIMDIDGNEYVDYIGSWGPLILGHAHPEVNKAAASAITSGASFGLPTEIETRMANLISKIVPSIEKVRMVNSGTEATMSALRLARGYTKRNKILKFQGGYHGHADALLVRSGSAIATLGLPDSPGVSKSVVADTLAVPYNHIESVEHMFEQFGEQIAAVIVEPVAGNMGVVPPQPGFLHALRELTRHYGSLLIFDEVMTGFRVAYQGAQHFYGIDPDLTCLGKIIGGGFPVGAYGGKQEIMDMVAPEGPVYQAGTLSGNPVAMNAGYKTLQLLGQPGVYDELERKSARLAEGFKGNSDRTGIPLTINRVGSMLCPYFTNREVIDFETAQFADNDLFKEYYPWMLEHGILLAPTPYEAMFVSLAHSDEDIEMTIEAHYQVLKKLSNSGKIIKT